MELHDHSTGNREEEGSCQTGREPLQSPGGGQQHDDAVKTNDIPEEPQEGPEPLSPFLKT